MLPPVVLVGILLRVVLTLDPRLFLAVPDANSFRIFFLIFISQINPEPAVLTAILSLLSLVEHSFSFFDGELSVSEKSST